MLFGVFSVKLSRAIFVFAANNREVTLEGMRFYIFAFLFNPAPVAVFLILFTFCFMWLKLLKLRKIILLCEDLRKDSPN